MGRIALHWKKIIEDAGYQYIHIGAAEVPIKYHVLLWGFWVKQYLKKSGIKPDLLLVHEPLAGFFLNLKVPVILFSHGLEERSWEISRQFGFIRRTLKSALLPNRLRFWSNRKGIKQANMLLLSNSTDKAYVMAKYKRSETDIKIFLNGCSRSGVRKSREAQALHYLFNGTWIKRKGTDLIIEAFDELWRGGYKDWLLTLSGTVISTKKVLEEIPSYLHQNIEVIPTFNEYEEASIYQKADIFLFPSYFEGQSLALNQALASGLCCIASDNSGQLDVIQNGVNGLLFETGSVQSLISCIQRVRQDRLLLNTLGLQAQYQGVTWEHAEDSFIGYVSEILMNTEKITREAS
jgi:glycosyltransferase involved in cell wall biosynthesis